MEKKDHIDIVAKDGTVVETIPKLMMKKAKLSPGYISTAFRLLEDNKRKAEKALAKKSSAKKKKQSERHPCVSGIEMQNFFANKRN